MTPAINLLIKQNVGHTIHEYNHDARAESFGLEAADKLNVDASRVFKTLVVETDNKELAVAIVPVNRQLNLKSLAKALKVKKANMADTKKVERSTGYVLGGVSPLGQKKRLRTVIDETTSLFDTIYVSAGKRGLEIELPATALAKLLNADFANIATE
ncbi:Cys-tRNA(Pro) deacylase [Bermanella marisrubri]|uniref:Cys-tRNA(Pro)/Cys-tRNA(Cys) deacylase n=1 Tax=Bermanella marisrubri TaxID=207949 RepID=Q1N040_9GAMM|nr:Cys-tRNA(Pro) deacylase [Bermanella marisrubri]EAT11523.1 hypothetical protein RED65_02594 [Oceanobacter sp. RED65] [Bermanella marisrubri]QIZ85012.1 Cys-tRNA(Pro) deacylase [Bermanella marisrubri]